MKRTDIHIRHEKIDDYEPIDNVITEAFAHAEHADGNESNLVRALRQGAAYIPELALVAEYNHEIVGYIMFTKAMVDKTEVLALAPLAVLPSFQGQGIGKILITEGHHIADTLGYPYSVVLGSDTYYPKMGYVPAHTFGITPPFPVEEKYFMACKIQKTAPAVSGTMRYATEFGCV